jgi:hypothetical protein
MCTEEYFRFSCDHKELNVRHPCVFKLNTDDRVKLLHYSVDDPKIRENNERCAESVMKTEVPTPGICHGCKLREMMKKQQGDVE